MDRQSSDRYSYDPRQNKRTWGKNCHCVYKKLDQIDGYCGNTLSIVKIVKKIFILYIFKAPVHGMVETNWGDNIQESSQCVDTRYSWVSYLFENYLTQH